VNYDNSNLCKTLHNIEQVIHDDHNFLIKNTKIKEFFIFGNIEFLVRIKKSSYMMVQLRNNLSYTKIPILSRFENSSVEKFTQNVCETNWENFFNNYRKRIEEVILGRKKNGVFCLTIDLVGNSNYLLIAKIMNYFTTHSSLKAIIRQCVTRDFQERYCQNILKIKYFRQSIFSSWVMHLIVQNLIKNFQMYICYLNIFKPILNFNKFEIRNCKTFCFAKQKDLLMLLIFQDRITKWLNGIFFNKKSIQSVISHSIVSLNNQSIFFHRTEPEIQNCEKKIPIKGPIPTVSKFGLTIQRRISKKYKNDHLHYLKEILQRKQANNQIQLIPQLKEIIQKWDSYFLMYLHKREYSRLNSLFYRLLWKWSILRHGQKTSQWIKQKYWHQLSHGIYFGSIKKTKKIENIQI
jgi:hypothetical protein